MYLRSRMFRNKGAEEGNLQEKPSPRERMFCEAGLRSHLTRILLLSHGSQISLHIPVI